MFSGKLKITDLQSASEYAEAWHQDQQTKIVEQFPNGTRIEAVIEHLIRPRICIRLVKDRKGECRCMSLERALSFKGRISLAESRPIWVRSVGCPNITEFQDVEYTLNYGAPQGMMRVRVGTRSNVSKSRFWTSIAIHSPMGEPIFDGEKIWTRLPCLPSKAVRVDLPDLAKKVLSEGTICDSSWSSTF